MATPQVSSRKITEFWTAESSEPLSSNRNHQKKMPTPYRTPLAVLATLRGRVTTCADKAEFSTLRLDLLDGFSDISLTDRHSDTSTSQDLHQPKTPPPSRRPRLQYPQTGLPSPSILAGTRPVRSYPPSRKLSFESSTSSHSTTEGTPAAVYSTAEEEQPDPTFMALANYFVKGIPTIEASQRAHRLIAAMDSFLIENPNDPIALATKALALIVRGEVADFVEVFHRTHPEHMMRVVDILMQVLTKAEYAVALNPRNLIALVIKTGCLGLKGQYEQVMSTESYSSAPEDLEPRENPLSQTAQMQSLYLESVHEETVASAEELLLLEPDHLTGIFMKVQGLTFQGKTGKILETLTLAMKTHPNNAILWTLFARYYFDDQPKKALDAVTIAMTIDPKHFLSHAIRLQLLGQMEDAVGFLKAKDETEKLLSPMHPLILEIVKEFMPEILRNKEHHK